MALGAFNCITNTSNVSLRYSKQSCSILPIPQQQKRNQNDVIQNEVSNVNLCFGDYLYRAHFPSYPMEFHHHKTSAGKFKIVISLGQCRAWTAFLLLQILENMNFFHTCYLYVQEFAIFMHQSK